MSGKKNKKDPDSESPEISDQAEGTLDFQPNPCTISLPCFEGPLDLLLNLIREHKLDIFNIPILFVTEKFIEHLDKMRELDLDIAGDYLRMAATLAYIKSRMLLPVPESEADEDDENDPRADLVKRLLTYQQFKDAAQELLKRPQLGRDIFSRASRELSEFTVEDPPLIESSIFELGMAYMSVRRKLKTDVPEEITAERMTIAQKIFELVELFSTAPEKRFSGLLQSGCNVRELILTFLAVLEMTKMKLVRVFQVERDGEIFVKCLIEPVDLETRRGEISTIEYR